MSDALSPTGQQPQNLVPVTVLTGFLGAVQTTLLNHILTAEPGRKYAVAIYEYV